MSVLPQQHPSRKENSARFLCANLIRAIVSEPCLTERSLLYKGLGPIEEVLSALRRLVACGVITSVPVAHWGHVYRVAQVGASRFSAGARIEAA